MKIFAIVVFIAMYVFIVALPNHRFLSALVAAAVLVISGVLPLKDVPGAIDWNIILMLLGTMLIVDYFIDSGMPSRMAGALMSRSKSVMWLIILMSVFAGVVSAFLDNVATVLMIAPVGLVICEKMGISPVPMLLSISVSSNLQGAATLVGDTTSIMLGAQAKMDFNSFFFMEGKPGMFFATEMGALATIPIMIFLFRKERNKRPPAPDKVKVNDYIPSIMLLLQISLLITASFIKDKPAVTNGIICVACGLITIILELIRTKNTQSLKKCIAGIDYKTILLLSGLFIVISGISKVGIIDDIAHIIASIGKGNVFILYTVIVWGSVLISAFIDNIPYVATMLPVVAVLAQSGGFSPYPVYFGLLCGATLGGNISPIGASANIATVGMLQKRGYKVGFGDFMKIGVPFTLAAVTVSYFFVWAVWGV